MNAMFNDNDKDPPPRKINEHSKKKQKVDSSTPVAKKPLRKKKASYSKTKKGKQTAQVIFPHIQSKLDIHVEKVAVSKPESHVEKEAFISKKDFDAFRDETSDEKIDETILSDSKFTIPDVILPSLNAYKIQSIIIHPSVNRQEESRHEILDAKTSETVIEDHAQMNREITDLSSNSLVNSEVELATEERVRKPPNTQEDKKSIMIHPSANREVKNPRPKLRIRRPSKFKESPYTKKFGSAAERCIFLYDSYESSGHYAAVLAEIEKIAKIIPFYLQACDFYVKKEIDLQNHPRYKDKESSNMFDILFKDDLSQQPSGSLDCGVFMVMYAECLSYGHKVIANEFDPNALRTRYAALLWDYGI
ncbi:hypothetical protein FXO37_08439 [Capsicum annuum]|nr:hypothetical protein FXO37_08439 [Capsicum annuum]